MNKAILLGRLTAEPEVRTSRDGNGRFATYTLAVKRQYHADGEPDTDFIECITFSKNVDFVEKYLKKGMLIGVVGSILITKWTDKEKKNHYIYKVSVHEHYFAEKKKDKGTSAKPDEDDDMSF